ncbi:hypothetical protein NBT05_01140 [Aquimarina sp. ERC-38]|uniref:arsenate reductase family protein n=1 Tax=Aquimarina sp. ERC-38 TaxID=2949996 RepID=UPI002247D115|nr:hypothetical protein [Aquimarina sp. ERC-38]UZO81096.1 hypothetical protein NBT05_01140 [Aquimarina sp. ERC-38]
MGVLAVDANQITLIYNSNTYLGKNARGYVDTALRDIRLIDTAETKLTGTEWVEIAHNLNIKLEDIINKEHPDFTSKYDKNISLDANDWIKVLDHSPEVVHGGILIVGHDFIKLENGSDVARYLKFDSAGIDRNPEKPHLE